jgi:hypothetical protein
VKRALRWVLLDEEERGEYALERPMPPADASNGTPTKKASVTKSASAVLSREDAITPPGIA